MCVDHGSVTTDSEILSFPNRYHSVCSSLASLTASDVLSERRYDDGDVVHTQTRLRKRFRLLPTSFVLTNRLEHLLRRLDPIDLDRSRDGVSDSRDFLIRIRFRSNRKVVHMRRRRGEDGLEFRVAGFCEGLHLSGVVSDDNLSDLVESGEPDVVGVIGDGETEEISASGRIVVSY